MKHKIDNNAVDSINTAIRALEKIEQYDEKYAEIVSRLKSCYYEVQEVGRDLECEDIYFDENEQNEIEARLDLINSLKRKYGSTIQQILDYGEQIQKEIFDIENSEKRNMELKKELAKIQNKMLEKCEKMNEVRIKYSQKLSNQITKQLKELEMKNAEFEVNVELLEDKKFNVNGLNKVEFLISTNKGDDKKSLIKIASGGEMSRVMLAIKTVLADVDKTPVLVFDEIDTGISGIAANSTGEKMKKIAKSHQVICVTHLASIAAKGDFNYYIYKDNLEDVTKTHVKQLDEDSTIKEIARIANGEITEISLQNARELRKNSKKIA